jgi:hypothetical protein
LLVHYNQIGKYKTSIIKWHGGVKRVLPLSLEDSRMAQA